MDGMHHPEDYCMMDKMDSTQSEDLLSAEQIAELQTGIARHFKESTYQVFFQLNEKPPITPSEFRFFLCKQLQDGSNYLAQCPIYLNLEMYFHLLQTGNFSNFLETMEELMWGIGQYNQKLSHIMFDSICKGEKSDEWIQAYKTKAMPALDYSYLILNDDLDAIHSVKEISLYNARLKDIFASLLGIHQLSLAQTDRQSYLKDLTFEFSIGKADMRYSYREFLQLLQDKEAFHQWILSMLRDAMAENTSS